jgi:hypothetical protein
MKAASDQVEQYLAGDGAAMSESAVSAMDSVMMANDMKLRAEKVREKYTTALQTLGATDEQVQRLNDALTDLTNAMIAAFKDMEQVFAAEDTLGDSADIQTAYDTLNTAIQTAFSNFLAASAATDAEIDDMVDAMQTAFAKGDYAGMDLNAMKDPDSDGDYADNGHMHEGAAHGMFSFFMPGGGEGGGTYYNWPITMVVPVTWLATKHADDFNYTRDELEVPASMAWLDGNNDGVPDQTRHDFQESFGMPPVLAGLFDLREDIEIIGARKWAGLAAASRDMTFEGYSTLTGPDLDNADTYIGEGSLEVFAEGEGDDPIAEGLEEGDDYEGIVLDTMQCLENLFPYLTGEEMEGLEDLYLDRIAARKAVITSTNEANPISDDEKQALIDTATMPDFR